MLKVVSKICPHFFPVGLLEMPSMQRVGWKHGDVLHKLIARCSLAWDSV